jgi:NTE family protein
MADTSSKDQQRNDKPYVIMALQGGGALGAFQAGAYKAFCEKGYEPDWVSGISIGAINASIIAGNPQATRLSRLLEFWDVVAGTLNWWECFPNYSEKLANLWKVWLSAVGGVPGFFQPNCVPPWFAPRNTPQACSLYNVEKLKKTLQSLIDFDFLNDQKSPARIRLSLGATQVFGGVSETFENFDGGTDRITDHRITADHIMASGADAPCFPGVVINGRLYWDGGITSNSSFRHIIPGLGDLTANENKPVVVFVIDLWGAFNRDPKTFDEVCWTIKQIQYCSGIEHDIDHGRHFLDKERLDQTGPGKRSAKWKSHIDIVRVSYRCDPNEIPWGDALFSRTDIERRIADGYAATLYLLELDPHPWFLPRRDEWVRKHLL